MGGLRGIEDWLHNWGDIIPPDTRHWVRLNTARNSLDCVTVILSPVRISMEVLIVGLQFSTAFDEKYFNVIETVECHVYIYLH